MWKAYFLSVNNHIMIFFSRIGKSYKVKDMEIRFSKSQHYLINILFVMVWVIKAKKSLLCFCQKGGQKCFQGHLFFISLISWAMMSLGSLAKLYIPRTINIWKKVLTKDVWADKKWAGFWQISLYMK